MDGSVTEIRVLAVLVCVEAVALLVETVLLIALVIA